MSKKPTAKSLPLGVIDELVPDVPAPDRYRFWLSLATVPKVLREKFSRAVVHRECLPDPEAELTFEAGELLEG